MFGYNNRLTLFQIDLKYEGFKEQMSDLDTCSITKVIFTTVVVLREQVRVTDIRWRDFLRRLWKGLVREDETML